MVSAKSSTSAGGLASAATGIRPTRNGASHAITRRSVWTSSPTEGRWTLTTTSSPVRSVARWTWAIDAAARGSGWKRCEHVLQRPAEVVLHHPPHDGERLRRDLVAAPLELRDELLGEDPLPGADDLPQLDVGRPELLDGQPQAP